MIKIQGQGFPCPPDPPLKKRGKGRGPVLLLLTLWFVLAQMAGQAPGVPQGGYAHPEALMQPEELKAALDRQDPHLRIIDVRHKAKYYLGHVPGAQQIWRPILENPKGPGLMPPQTQMETLLGRLGVGGKDTLVLYGDQFDHARLWLILAYYGFPLERMKLLDGGLEGWRSKGYPTQITSPQFKRTRFKLPGPAEKPTLTATLAEVKGAVQNPRKVIVDTRSQREYLGEETKEGAARTGHIPGAVWLEWKETKVAAGPHKGFWKTGDEIKNIYAAKGVIPDKDIYLYGHRGLTPPHSLVSLYLAGYPLEKLHFYAGSWVEWSRSQEPVETGGLDLPAKPQKTKKAPKTRASGKKAKP